jgi:outer membrane protein assembly factor BamB
MSALAAVLILAFPAQEEERLLVKQAEDSFTKRWAAAEEASDWKKRVELHKYACERLSDCLAQPDPSLARWIALPRVLAGKLSRIPGGEREMHETVARQLLESVQERTHRRDVVERYAWTQTGQDALEAMANEDFDQGRPRDAVRGWTRALEVRFSPDVVARLAYAHASSADGQALAALGAAAERNSWKGEIAVAGRRRELGEFISSLRPAAAPPPLLRPSPAPLATNEIPLGAYDFREDGNAFGRGFALSVPACARIGGREVVVVTNGIRVIAFDPARAQGGTLADAVDWRQPKDAGVRSSVPSVYSRPNPLVGAAVGGARVYMTLFSSIDRRTQVGRRSDRFEGPAALRAFDLASGEPLWDTDTLWPEGSGETVGGDNRDFWKYNFCFAGPPLVRGDRLFAVAMTVAPNRQANVVCLDAATGKIVWNTWVASAPATRSPNSVPQLAEEDGTIVLTTGFGVLAALDARSGAVEWLVKHRTATASRYGVSPPVIHRSLVYVLAQDCEELLAVDRWTGHEVAALQPREEISWSQIQTLVGRTGDWLVFSGRKSCAVRVTDGKVVELAGDESERAGRGMLAGPYLYLPAKGALQVYDTATWKLRESHPRADDNANLAVFDSLVVLLGDRLELATSREGLRSRFAVKADAQPARPDACRQLASILEAAGRPVEAVPYYRRALKTWEKDPAWQESAEGLRKKLADLADKLGDEFPK